MIDVVCRLAAIFSRALYLALLFLPVSVFSQNNTAVVVSGKVVDEQGNPMVGVTIIETGGGY